MGFFQEFLKIFIDNEEKISFDIIPHSLYEKYKKELGELYFDDIFVWIEYRKILPILEQYKYYSNRDSGIFLSKIYTEIIEKIDENFSDYILVPIPMHWTRYCIRWVDSMGFLAQKIAKNSQKSYQKILWTKFSRRQISLSREKRIQNRQNIFYVKNFKKIPEKIILIDDIVTTGITINEASRVLRQYGAKKIIVICLASNY